ncbi:MAG: hypothetical protein ACKVU1_11305 [bacterium]
MRALRAVGVLLFLTLACSERPDAPARSSPFDPSNPNGADPFALVAQPTGAVINLDWNDVRVAESLGYSVYRSRSLASLLTDPDTILAAGLDSSGFRDERPLHGTTSYYAVTIRNARGEESVRSEAAAARLTLSPSIEVRRSDGEATFFTDSRFVKLRVIATDADSILLSNRIEKGELVEPARLAYTTESIDWELETNPPGVSLSKSVYARALYAGIDTASAIFADTLVTRVPGFQILVDGIADGVIVTGRKKVAVSVTSRASTNDPPPGADSVQFALGRPFEAPWQAFPDEASGFTLDAVLETAALDTLYVLVKNDIGVAGVESAFVRGDSLLDASIVINNSLEPAAAATTRLARVNVHVVGANATAICLSNAPIPPCTEFEPFESSPRESWPLARPAGDGAAIVYAIVANEWRPEGAAVLVDSINVQIASLQIVIFYPDGFDVSYGDSTAVEGSARARAFGPDIANISIVADGDTLDDVAIFPSAASDTFDVDWSATWAVREAGPDTLTSIIATVTDAEGGRASDTLAINIFQPFLNTRRGPAR